MTNERKIRLLKAALKRAVYYLPAPVAVTMLRILDRVS